jgi:aryl-alcohol dehydrogenase-like predicted oxidoreductase
MENKISRLGFGLSSIAGSGNFAHQERLVKTAIDSGITHFDGAPYYGSGDAEKILGDILATCTEKVTITTKFGLIPLSGGAGGSFLRSALRPVFRKMSYLKKIASSVLNKAHQPKPMVFEKGDLIKSIEISIAKLRRSPDIFLLHDVEISLAQNPNLIEELEQVKQDGRAKITGISGTADDLYQMSAWRPDLYRVVQLENSLKTPAPIQKLKDTGATVITHRAIQGGLNELVFLIKNRRHFKDVWEREIGIDPSNKEELANALIELALTENPEGTILFSSTSPERIKKVASVLNSPKLGIEGCQNLRNIFNDVYVERGEVV